jgi:hypothetical protein
MKFIQSNPIYGKKFKEIIEEVEVVPDKVKNIMKISVN